MAHEALVKIGSRSKIDHIDVGGGTQRSWTADHACITLRGHARRLRLLQLYFFLLTLALSLAAQAQDMAGAQLSARSSTGGSIELPLVSEELSITIDQGHASTSFAQSFQNETKEVLEGRYTIALGTVASATGFAYYNGEEKIVGEIFEKEAATRIYSEVAGSGRDPGLFEQVGEGAFSFRVAPISASEKKRVLVETSALLSQKGATYEYQAPLGNTAHTRASLRIIDERPISKVWSPTHTLDVQDAEGGKLVRVVAASNGSAKVDRLVVRYTVEEQPFQITTALHRDVGQDPYLLVSIGAPSGMHGAQQPRDVTLVIDRSGSMGGAPLDAAKAAARGVIKKLRADDRVNVVVFDDGVDSLYSAPRSSAQVRQSALDYVANIQSGGGTDIALALRAALEHQVKDGNQRSQVVLFLTDGQSNAQAALDAAKPAPGNLRLYPVGIGSGVDRALLARLAQTTRGIFTYVADETNLERDVEKLYARIGSPLLSELKLEVDGASISRAYPRISSDLFEDDRLVYALRLHTDSTQATVRVTGKSDKKVETFVKEIALAPQARPWVARHWASQRVDDLLQQMAEKGELDELKKETLELALAYDLVTKYTSFLAIPESEITDAVRGSIEEQRARHAQILSKHKDAAALSRQVMPPGDPVISIKAPRSAQAVTALFPFGLELELHYNAHSERWEGRFLVPHDVQDGDYRVELFITNVAGELSTTTTSYTIDSRPPAFDVYSTVEATGVALHIVADEKLREVRVLTLDGQALAQGGRGCGQSKRRACALSPISSTEYDGFVELGEGEHTLQIIVVDQARNESVQMQVVHIKAEGC